MFHLPLSKLITITFIQQHISREEREARPAVLHQKNLYCMRHLTFSQAVLTAVVFSLAQPARTTKLSHSMTNTVVFFGKKLRCISQADVLSKHSISFAQLHPKHPSCLSFLEFPTPKPFPVGIDFLLLPTR